jgi:K+-sensing histidine kinase KdpD
VFVADCCDLQPFRDVAQAAIKRAQMLMTKHRMAVQIPENLPMMYIDVRALAQVIYTAR